MNVKDFLYDQNESGVYDMVINYSNTHNNINETIIIKEFLTVTR